MWVLSQLNSYHIIHITFENFYWQWKCKTIHFSTTEVVESVKQWKQNTTFQGEGGCVPAACLLFSSECHKTMLSYRWFQPIWKNISQIGNLRQVGVKMKKKWNHNLAILPLYVSTANVTVELCISGIITIFQVRVTIWLSIIVVFSSKWSNKGHMLSAQVSTFNTA